MEEVSKGSCCAKCKKGLLGGCEQRSCAPGSMLITGNQAGECVLLRGCRSHKSSNELVGENKRVGILPMR